MYKGENLSSDEKEPSLLDDQVECLPPPGDDLPYGENPVGTILEQPESIQISANGLKLLHHFDSKTLQNPWKRERRIFSIRLRN